MFNADCSWNKNFKLMKLFFNHLIKWSEMNVKELMHPLFLKVLSLNLHFYYIYKDLEAQRKQGADIKDRLGVCGAMLI